MSPNAWRIGTASLGSSLRMACLLATATSALASTLPLTASSAMAAISYWSPRRLMSPVITAFTPWFMATRRDDCSSRTSVGLGSFLASLRASPRLYTLIKLAPSMATPSIGSSVLSRTESPVWLAKSPISTETGP